MLHACVIFHPLWGTDITARRGVDCISHKGVCRCLNECIQKIIALRFSYFKTPSEGASAAAKHQHHETKKVFSPRDDLYTISASLCSQ